MPKIFDRPGVSPAAALCPYFGASIERASPPEKLEDLPTPGDLMLCIRCAGVLVFDDLMRPTAASEDALEALYGGAPGMREHVEEMQAGIHAVNAIGRMMRKKRRKTKDVPDA